MQNPCVYYHEYYQPGYVVGFVPINGVVHAIVQSTVKEPLVNVPIGSVIVHEDIEMARHQAKVKNDAERSA